MASCDLPTPSWRLHTGDVGVIVVDGCLCVANRSKDMFVDVLPLNAYAMLPETGLRVSV